jgi:hypothetical protein
MDKLCLLTKSSTLFTKLVNENLNDYDEHMSIVLFFYITTFKVRTGHTLF